MKTPADRDEFNQIMALAMQRMAALAPFFFKSPAPFTMRMDEGRIQIACKDPTMWLSQDEASQEQP